MPWRLAKSLEQLRKEANDLAPNRSKRSDGTIGDASHAARCSRHNPNDAGVVCALDLTHDPAGGFDAHAVAERLRQLASTGATNPCFEYVISNRRIASRSKGWQWGPYNGSNPHTSHVHFAVGRGSDCEPGPPYDDKTPWGIKPIQKPGGTVQVSLPVLREGSRGGAVKSLQALLNERAGKRLTVDGIFGPATDRAVRELQTYYRKPNDPFGPMPVDGIVGQRTWGVLFL